MVAISSREKCGRAAELPAYGSVDEARSSSGRVAAEEEAAV